MANCQQCGAELAAGQRFCPQCGSRQPDSPPAQAPGATVILPPSASPQLPPTQVLGQPESPPPAAPAGGFGLPPAEAGAPQPSPVPPGSYAQPAPPAQTKPRWGLVLGIIGGIVALACVALLAGGWFIARNFGEVVTSLTVVPVDATAVPGAFTEVLLSDDFSSEPRSRFIEESDSDGAFAFQGGEYVLTLERPNFFMWSPAGETYADAAIEIDATVEGPPDGAAVIMFRYLDDRNFYIFRVYGDGSYDLQRYLEDEPTDLVEQADSPALNGLGERNRLRVETEGDQIRLYANGELLAEVSDASFAEGDVALGISAGEMAGVQVIFDDLSITGAP